MYSNSEKPKKNKTDLVIRDIIQKKNKSNQKSVLTDNRSSLIDYKNVQESLHNNSEVKQLKGDRYYWVRPAGGQWEYVGAFKNHATANDWWASNKSSYPDGQFSQGNSKTKFK